MSRFVFDFSRHLVWRIVVMALTVIWCMTFALIVGSISPANAQTTITGSVGVDVWQTPTEPARYLPNYAVLGTWQAAAPWVRAQVQHRVDTDVGVLTLTGVGKADPVNKGRIDRLDADLRLGHGGVRAGILPYRISWCRADGGPWMAEPDAFCRFGGLNEVSQGAFGVQAYRSAVAGGFLIDGMAGVYRPLIDGQNDKLGPFVSIGPTVRHHAQGASLNAIHLATGIEARAGWIRTAQDQDSDSGSYQRRMRYDSYYLGLQGNVTKQVDVRASLSGYLGDQINPALLFEWDGRSKTLEVIFKPDSSQSLSAGLSRYTNITSYASGPNNQRLQVDSLSLAWRKDWAKGFYTVAQASRSLDDATTRRGVRSVRDGTAYGVRVAQVF